MRKRKKALAISLIAVFLAIAFAGCGKKELDAAAAVDAYLKAQTKGEFDDYAKIVGEEKEELEKEYNKTLDEVEAMFQQVEALGVSFGEDFTGEMKNLLASVKYEVIGAQKDGDSYVVDVDISPSDVMSLFIQNVISSVQSIKDMDEVGDAMLKAIRDAIANQSYGEAKRHQVHLDYNKDEKQYEINEDDVSELSKDFFELDTDVTELLGQMYTPSGTVYDNPYLNWTKTEWNAASDEEKDKCCLAMVQELQGLSDEEMATVDMNDETTQEAMKQMKDGIDLSFNSGMDISIGDYIEILRGQMGF